MTSTTTTARSRDFQERAARVFGGGTLSIWTLPDDVPITLSCGQGGARLGRGRARVCGLPHGIRPHAARSLSSGGHGRGAGAAGARHPLPPE